MAMASSTVSAGDDILATQYNNLRSDALITGEYAYSPVITRYASIPASHIVPKDNTQVWLITNVASAGVGSTANVTFYGGVNLPNGAIVTSFKVWWFRNDASAAGLCRLYQNDPNTGTTTMADASSNSTAGIHSVEYTTISAATVDNTQYSYHIDVLVQPNDSWTDVNFKIAMITYTIAVPFP